MKKRLIDSKGRIFGKINIIDLLIILVIVVLVVLALKFFVLPPREYVYVQLQLCEEGPFTWSGTYVVNCGNVPIYFSRSVNVGDEIIKLGKTKGRILEVSSNPITLETEDTEMRIELLSRKKKDGYEYYSQAIKAGSELRISTLNANIVGKIQSFSVNDSAARKEFKIKEVEIKAVNQSSEILRGLTRNDVEVDLTGKTIATIIDFEPVPKLDNKIDLTVKARLVTEKNGDSYWFKNLKVKIGYPIFIETQKVIFAGVITNVDEIEAQTVNKEMIIEVMLREQPLWISDSISIGDKEQYLGRTIMEVVGKDVQPSAVIINSNEGLVYAREHSYLQDIKLRLNVLADQRAGNWFYKDGFVKIGQKIIINTDKISVEGEITNIIK